MGRFAKIAAILGFSIGGYFGWRWLKKKQLHLPESTGSSEQYKKLAQEVAKKKSMRDFYTKEELRMQLSWTEAYNLIWLKTFMLFISKYELESAAKGKPILSHPDANMDWKRTSEHIATFFGDMGNATGLGAKIGGMIGGPVGSVIGAVGALVASMFSGIDKMTVGLKWKIMEEVEYPAQKMLSDAIVAIGPPPTELWHLAARIDSSLHYNPFLVPTDIARQLIRVYSKMAYQYSDVLMARVPTMGKAEMRTLRIELEDLGIAQIQVAFDGDLWTSMRQRTARGSKMFPGYIALHPGFVLRDWKFWIGKGPNSHIFYDKYIEILQKKPMPPIATGFGINFSERDLDHLKASLGMGDPSNTIFIVSPGTSSFEVPAATLAELFFGTGSISVKDEDWSTLLTVPMMTRTGSHKFVTNWFVTQSAYAARLADDWIELVPVSMKSDLQRAQDYSSLFRMETKAPEVPLKLQEKGVLVQKVTQSGPAQYMVLSGSRFEKPRDWW